MKRLCHKKTKQKKNWQNWHCGVTRMMHECENRKSKGVREEGLLMLMISISFFQVPKILPVTGSYNANVNILFQHWNSSIHQYKGEHVENIRLENNLTLVSLITNPGMDSGTSHPREHTQACERCGAAVWSVRPTTGHLIPSRMLAIFDPCPGLTSFLFPSSPDSCQACTHTRTRTHTMIHL